jgi:hypothetical protein
LTQLAANTSLLPSDLAGMIVQKYYSSYTASSAVTQSALDIGKIAVLIEAIDAFATRANTEWQALKDARASAVQYHIEGYPAFWGMDLWDFADKASTRVASTDIVAACAAVKNAVGQVIINELHGTGDSGSHGVALYFPKTKADYDNDIDYPGYEPTNTTMPVDYVQQHDWSKWLKDFYSHSP